MRGCAFFAGSERIPLGRLRLWNEELFEHVQIHDTGNGDLVPRSYTPGIFMGVC
jgi:hypothetical protein